MKYSPLFFFASLFFLWGISFGFAQTTYLDGPETGALGMTPYEAFGTFGAPETIYPQPGPAEWQQDVVFYYSDHSYLYWFENRVWQVRFDRRHKDPVLGVYMGSSQNLVRSVLGPPLADEPGELVYPMVERGFPMRLRLLFEEDRLIEAFLYRCDF